MGETGKENNEIQVKKNVLKELNCLLEIRQSSRAGKQTYVIEIVVLGLLRFLCPMKNLNFDFITGKLFNPFLGDGRMLSTSSPEKGNIVEESTKYIFQLEPLSSSLFPFSLILTINIQVRQTKCELVTSQ